MDLEARRAGHILAELGFAVRRDGEGFSGEAPIVPEMCVPDTTSVRLSVLAAWVDLLSGLVAIDVLGPRVPVTLELDVHLYAPAPGDGEVRVACRLVKGGRSVVVSAVELTDARGRRLGVGASSFMAAPDPTLLLPPGAGDPEAITANAGRLSQPFAERAGCVRRAPGVAAIGRADDGLNASNSLNGGLLALAVEEATLSRTPGTTLASLAMRYLRPVRVGPAVATAEVEAGLGLVEVIDEGDAGGPAVVATTRAFAPPDAASVPPAG